MKKISSDKIIEKVSALAIEVNYKLPENVKNSLIAASKKEKKSYGKKYLNAILKNLEIAEREKIPICQDTGISIVFVEMGNEIQINTGTYKTIEEIINKGIEKGYKKGFLRKSIVSVLDRKNTGTNTPGIIHFIPSEKEIFKITLMAKGFGSENTCALKMINPSEGKKGIEQFIIDTVKKAGAKPCPPVFLGVGIGGSFEKSAILSKMALCNVGRQNTSSTIKKWEKSILEKLNKLGIGVGGFGGRITALDVKIKTFPTHLAGLPVSVSISCWAHRVGTVIL